MINFLIALDVILAIFIIAGIFFHRGSDGFMGEATPSTTLEPRLETYDKIIGSFVIAFFLVTLSINYFTLYHYKGTADIDAIIDKAHLKKQIKQDNEKNSDTKTEAPLAQ